jgi:hypothetical protein
MQAYQSRVVVERDELARKFENLNRFLNSGACLTVPTPELKRLARQRLAMRLYLDVLEERIAEFKE